MSSEWVSVKLKDVATIRNGAGIKQNFFDTDGVPLVRVTNFTDTSIDLKDSVRVNVDHALKWQNHKLKAQDILIATVGSWPPNWSSVVGKAVSVPAAGAGSIQNQNTCCIQAIPGMADQRFLYYLARSQNFALYAANSASGSANQARLPVAKLECFEFHLPSLAEQKSIGSFLGALDDRITLLRETNATLEAIAQALFKSWFVDFDPVHANAAFLENGQAPSLPAEIQALFPSRLVESPQGLIPEGWEVGTVADLGDVICGKTPPTSKPENYGDEVPFITIPDMHGKIAVTQTARSLSKMGANTQPKKYLRPGSICVSCIATPGLVTRVTVASQTNQQINSVVPFEKWGDSYPLFAMQRVGALVRSGGSGGSVFHNLSKSGFEKIPVLLPSQDVIKHFDKTSSPIVEKIVANQNKIQTLAELRDTLLPRLISGQLRLPEAEAALAEVG
jgi:type I restriction enzyme S subunit